MKKLLFLPGVLAVTACSSLTPVDDPIYFRIQDVEARLIRIERVLENESLVSLASEINALRSETQGLLNEVETLRFELNRQGDSAQQLYIDLDERISQLQQAQQNIRSLPVAGQPGGAPAVAMTDQQSYDSAFASIEQGNFASAQQALEAFLVAYPNSSLRGNAQYWLAETHYGQLNFDRALGEFQKVLTDYPQSNKVPDALLKIGFTQIALGNNSAAQEALMRVIREYPDTNFATQANGRLAEISR